MFSEIWNAISVIGLLVGIGITYGLAKSEISRLKDDVAELKTTVQGIPKILVDVEWIKRELESQR